MLEWFGVFAANLANGLFWPFIILSLVAAAIAFYCEGIKREFNFGTAQYSGAIWAQHSSVQIVLIGWLLWAILNAVPEPNYLEKKVEVVKIREVSVADNLSRSYDKCMSVRDKHLNARPEDYSGFCTKQAEQIALGPKPVKKYVKVITKKVLAPREIRYKNVYETCLANQLQFLNREDTLKLIKTCSADAKSVVGL